MRTLLSAAAAAAILASSTMAFAATHHTTGMVKLMDTKTHMLTLADGSSYTLPQKFKDPGVKSGQKVSISWQQTGDNKTAEHVYIVK